MKWTIQFAFRLYKRWISPMLPHSCRFVPTCSEYAMEAVERHGTIRGSALAIGRLLRCHPFARSGFDPVPPEKPAVPQVRAHFLGANLGLVGEPRLAQRMGEPGAPARLTIYREPELG